MTANLQFLDYSFNLKQRKGVMVKKKIFFNLEPAYILYIQFVLNDYPIYFVLYKLY